MRRHDSDVRATPAWAVAACIAVCLGTTASAQTVGYGTGEPSRPLPGFSLPTGGPGLIRPAGMRVAPGVTNTPAAVAPVSPAPAEKIGVIHVRGPIANPHMKKLAIGRDPVSVGEVVGHAGGLSAASDGGFYIYRDGKRSATFDVETDSDLALYAGDVIIFGTATAEVADASDSSGDHGVGFAASRAAASYGDPQEIREFYVDSAITLTEFLARHGLSDLPPDAIEIINPGGIRTVGFEDGAETILEPGAKIIIRPRYFFARKAAEKAADSQATSDPVVASAPALNLPTIPEPKPANDSAIALPAVAPIGRSAVAARPPVDPPTLGPSPVDIGVTETTSPPAAADENAEVSLLTDRVDLGAVDILPPPPMSGAALAWQAPPAVEATEPAGASAVRVAAAPPIDTVSLAADEPAADTRTAAAGPSAAVLFLMSLPFVAAVGVLGWLGGTRFAELRGGSETGESSLPSETSAERHDVIEFSATDASAAAISGSIDATPEILSAEDEVHPAVSAPEETHTDVVPDEVTDETLRRLLRDDFPVEVEPLRLPASLKLFGRSPGLARLRVDAAGPVARGPHFAKTSSRAATAAAATPVATPVAAGGDVSPNAALVDAILRQAGLGSGGRTPS
ncbi:MAG: hypothetical protein AAF532_05905 [Planctomycetota bacterium]